MNSNNSAMINVFFTQDLLNEICQYLDISTIYNIHAIFRISMQFKYFLPLLKLRKNHICNICQDYFSAALFLNRCDYCDNHVCRDCCYECSNKDSYHNIWCDTIICIKCSNNSDCKCAECSEFYCKIHIKNHKFCPD